VGGNAVEVGPVVAEVDTASLDLVVDGAGRATGFGAHAASITSATATDPRSGTRRQPIPTHLPRARVGPVRAAQGSLDEVAVNRDGSGLP